MTAVIRFTSMRGFERPEYEIQCYPYFNGLHFTELDENGEKRFYGYVGKEMSVLTPHATLLDSVKISDDGAYVWENGPETGSRFLDAPIAKCMDDEKTNGHFAFVEVPLVVCVILKHKSWEHLDILDGIIAMARSLMSGIVGDRKVLDLTLQKNDRLIKKEFAYTIDEMDVIDEAYQTEQAKCDCFVAKDW